MVGVFQIMASWGLNEAACREYEQRTGRKVRGLESEPVTKPQKQQTKLIRQAQKDPRNKAEKAFESEWLYFCKLRGELVDYYEHGAIRLKLNNGEFYTPDYPAIEINPAGGVRTVFFEIKGEMRNGRVKARDDAISKIKQAPRRYPHYRFVLVWKCPETGEWLQQEVKP